MKKNNKLGIFALAMINVAAVMSLRNLPSMAEYGFSLIFYIALGSLCFFIPSALVSAELASGWQKEGGVFLWVREAFGTKWGFVAIFMQWVEKGATFLNFRGMKLSAFLSSSGVISGTILPGILIIILGLIHVFSGKPLAINFSIHSLVPQLGNLNQLMLLAGMMMAISGMEMSAVHVTEVENPGKNYPLSILIASIIIIFLVVAGSLAIAIVIPTDKLSLSAGVCQAFDELFKAHGLPWLTPIISFLLAYGALTMVVTWMAGPSKGVREVAKEGYLPKFWQKENDKGMPVGMLIVQAAFSSILSLVVIFMPTVSGAFWIMSALAAQLYLVMYLLMFAAAIKLRYTQPDVERPYKIPGGKFGMWLVSGIAFISCIFIMIFGFIPTQAVRDKGTASMVGYVAFLLIGVIVFVATPIIFYNRAEKRKKRKRD